MTGEREFEHDDEFDDLRSARDGVEIETDTEIDLDGGEEPDELDEPPAADAQALAEADFDLDELLPPAPPVDERYTQLATELTDQKLKDKQDKAVSTARAAVTKLESETADLRAKLIEAREKGETTKSVELEEQLDDKRLDLRDQKRALQWYESDEFKKKLAEQNPPPKDDKADKLAERRERLRQTLEAKPAMKTWLGKNRWYMKPADNQTAEEQSAAALVKSLEGELTKKGINNGDPKFYAEINKHLAKRFPEMIKAPSTEKSSVPSGGGEGGGARRSTGRRVVVTAEDKKAMRKFGLDPNNKNHLLRWAKEGK